MAMFSNNNDVFRTQADTRFNSFADPQNPVNQNSGNWGIDPNYLTPSFTSPFRPQYQGPAGNTYGRGTPGFGTSVNQIFNPFAGGGTNYGGNYQQQTSPFYDSLVNRPTNAAASFTQNWLAPGIASWGAYKHLSNPAGRYGAAATQGLARGLFGSSIDASLTGGAMRAAGGIGRMAGSTLLPLFAAQAAVSGFDSAVMDPYVAQRQMGSSLRSNFAGVNFGEGTGDRFTGGGLSRAYAQNIAKNVSVAGARDMTFNQTETSQLTDLSSRAGLLDNTSSTQMSSRFEAIMKQVKVVMAIANTSDFKETIEIMSKMQMSGVNPNALSSAMGRMGAMAGAGGQSLQKMMNTVGVQGQYMFGAAGLTPYEGTVSAMGASASHAAAYRSGLISPAMMARMGGTEGATQSSVAGTIGIYSTPYASMVGSNAYRGGGATGNIVSNMAKFGGGISSNPLQNIASHYALKNATTSKMISEQGLQGEQDMIRQIAEQIPGGVDKSTGKVSAEIAYMIMTEVMQISPESATAKLAQFNSVSDKKTNLAMRAGIGTASHNAITKYRQQEGLDKGIFTRPINAVKRAGMRVQESGALAVGGLLETMGGIGDVVENSVNRTMFGVSPLSEGVSMAQADSLSSGVQIYDLGKAFGSMSGGGAAGYRMGGKSRDSKTRNGLGEINKLVRQGNTDAAIFIKASGKEKQEALYRLIKSGKFGKEFEGSKEAGKLIAAAEQTSTRLIKEGDIQSGYLLDNSTEGIISDRLSKLNLGKTTEQSLTEIGISSKIYEQMLSGKKVDDTDIESLSEATGVSVKDLRDPRKLEETLKDINKRAGKTIEQSLTGVGIGFKIYSQMLSGKKVNNKDIESLSQATGVSVKDLQDPRKLEETVKDINKRVGKTAEQSLTEIGISSKIYEQMLSGKKVDDTDIESLSQATGINVKDLQDPQKLKETVKDINKRVGKTAEQSLTAIKASSKIYEQMLSGKKVDDTDIESLSKAIGVSIKDLQDPRNLEAAVKDVNKRAEKTTEQSLTAIRVSSKIYGQISSGKGVDDKDIESLSEATGISVKNLQDPWKLEETVKDINKRVGKAQVGHLAAYSVGKDGTVKDLVGKMRAAGDVALIPSIGGEDSRAIYEQSEVQKAMSKSRTDLKSLLDNGKIDGTTYMNGTNSLDNKETVGKFSQAVDVFAQAMKGKDSDTVPGITDFMFKTDKYKEYNSRTATNGKPP